MKRTIVLYGIAIAILVVVLRFLEYRYFIREMSSEIYIGLIALLFTVLGVWIGGKVVKRKTLIVQSSDIEFAVDQEVTKKLGISQREYDVLESMAEGLSNQEIAEKLFISINTIKTHSSNLFLKLDVKRRTQAIQKAKELHLIQ